MMFNCNGLQKCSHKVFNPVASGCFQIVPVIKMRFFNFLISRKAKLMALIKLPFCVVYYHQQTSLQC